VNTGVTTLEGSSLYLKKGMVISNIIFNQASLSASATMYLALYDNSGLQRAITNSFGNATGLRTIPVIVPYTIPSSGIYYASLILAGNAVNVSGVPSTICNLNRAVGGGLVNVRSWTSLVVSGVPPASLSSITASVNYMWFSLS